jgi:uncharacterized protein (TIGR03083 family)
MELHTLYAAQQNQFTPLVLEHSDRSTARVPACPEWKVHDVLAHVVELASDAVTGGLPTMDLLEQWRDDEVMETRDHMTAIQVERRADGSIEGLVHDWRQLIPTISPMLKGDIPFPEPALFGLGAILITDLEIHYQDVRGALGLPPGDDGPALSLAVATYCFGVDYRIRALDLPALAVRYAGKQRILGNGEPQATVTGDRFELLRALGGRRSRKQILALDWNGDPDPYLAIIPAYGERADDLVE